MTLLATKFFINLTRRKSRGLLTILSPVSYTARNNGTFKDSFKFDDLNVHINSESKNPKIDFKNLTFGTAFSDHMLEIEWTESKGWDTPFISPLHLLHLHPGAKVLHYAQAVFEGMKAFRHSNKSIALFRPEMNMKRFLETSQRACLPSFNCEELLKCIKKLVSIDKSWVPNQELCSLYIRPTFIGIENALGIAAAKKALLYVITGPVGPYFESSIKPISLLADPKYVRAFPGGVGSYKMASNYAPTLYVQKVAQQQQMDQVLWLFGEDHQITEAGGMNLFFVFQNKDGNKELATAPLDGTILPGVVRQTLLDLGRKWNEFKVSERKITMKEVINALDKGCLLEMFASGTAVSVCPVKLIKFDNRDMQIPTMKAQNPLYARFLKTLTDIQYGRIKSDWSVLINEK